MRKIFFPKKQLNSHLQGMFHRTIRMMKNGMKPVFVFDGKPPQLKSDELSKRKEKRDEAIEGAKEAKETGNVEEQVCVVVVETF